MCNAAMRSVVTAKRADRLAASMNPALRVPCEASPLPSTTTETLSRSTFTRLRRKPRLPVLRSPLGLLSQHHQAFLICVDIDFARVDLLCVHCLTGGLF